MKQIQKLIQLREHHEKLEAAFKTVYSEATAAINTINELNNNCALYGLSPKPEEVLEALKCEMSACVIRMTEGEIKELKKYS